MCWAGWNGAAPGSCTEAGQRPIGGPWRWPASLRPPPADALARRCPHSSTPFRSPGPGKPSHKHITVHPIMVGSPESRKDSIPGPSSRSLQHGVAKTILAGQSSIGCSGAHRTPPPRSECEHSRRCLVTPSASPLVSSVRTPARRVQSRGECWSVPHLQRGSCHCLGRGNNNPASIAGQPLAT
eukprot:269025-Rhodomonas_salina.2